LLTDANRGGAHLLLWAGVVLFALALLSAMSLAVFTFGTDQQPNSIQPGDLGLTAVTNTYLVSSTEVGGRSC
jgi:hypothetical protein